MKRFIFFAINGFIGFLVDASLLLFLIKYLNIGPFLARALAISAALFMTWQLNRVFSFGKSKHRLFIEALRYTLIGGVSALLNYMIYVGLLILQPNLQPLVAMTLASAAAMLFSFFGYSWFVFRR